MLAGVEILLERMKTNPEEFVEGGYSKWSRVMGSGWDILTEDERTALQNAHNEAKRDHFTGEVLRVLAQGHDEQLAIAGDYDRLASTYTTNLGKSMATTSSNIASKLLRDEMDKQYDAYKTKKVIQRGKPHA